MKKKRMGTILLILLLIVFFSVLSGCAEKDSAEKPTTIIQTETTTVATPKPTSTPVVTPTPTSAPTPSPKPTLSTEDELSMAPDVAGLEKGIQDGKIVYMAMEGNEYGIDAGEVVGILISKDIISVEGNQTGGVALDSRVVKVLRDKAIAAIPENETLKTKIILPLDVTKLTKEDGFNIDYAKATSFDINKNCIVVRFNNPIDLVNSSYYGNQFGRSDDLFALSFNKDGNDFELKNLSLISISTEEGVVENNNDFMFDGSVSTFATYKQFLFGDKLDLTANSFFVISQVFRETDIIDIDPSFLLKTESGAIIFIYPNNLSF